MLYITTSDTKDVYTAPYTLGNDYSPDGGAFVPYTLPRLEKDELASWLNLSFGQTVANVLNMFFPTHLTGWDVEFCIGRNSIRLFGMSRMMMLAEIWHNPEAGFSYAVANLYQKMGFNKGTEPTDWFCVAVRIAYLFGLYLEMVRNDALKCNETFDICVGIDDASSFPAALYAKQMGLPVSKVICTCVGSGAAWDLIHRGVYNPSSDLPEHRRVMERIILSQLGAAEMIRFRECCASRRNYSVDEELLPKLNDGLFCVVTGENRAEATINSVYRSCSYLIAPSTALYCGAVQDYRAKTGESRLVLIMIRDDPRTAADVISKATGMSQQKLWDRSN